MKPPFRFRFQKMIDRPKQSLVTDLYWEGAEISEVNKYQSKAKSRDGVIVKLTLGCNENSE